MGQQSPWRPPTVSIFPERKTWTMQSEYQKWESARYPSSLYVSRGIKMSLVHILQVYMVSSKCELCLVLVPCGGVLWPGAAELHASGPGKPEWNSHQWQQNLTGQYYVKFSFCFCFWIISFSHHLISKTSVSSVHTCFIVCSPKPSVSHMHWCTVMRWRWERLCCHSTSTQGPIPVMAVSLVRWWLTSANTGEERRVQVSHTKRKHIHSKIRPVLYTCPSVWKAWSNPFHKQRLCVR